MSLLVSRQALQDTLPEPGNVSLRRKNEIITANWLLLMAKYIYEHKNYTDFSGQDKAINVLFGGVRLTQGKTKCCKMAISQNVYRMMLRNLNQANSYSDFYQMGSAISKNLKSCMALLNPAN